MLKWTVLTRRDSQLEPKSATCNRLSLNFPSTESLPQTPRQKAKRRRSSASRRASTQKRCSLDALEADKENQFHSTPIKNNSSVEAFSPFRDVSNLTPSKEQFRRIQNSPKIKIKKKKECLESHHGPRKSNESNYFKPFEAVDSHIESIFAEDLCKCNNFFSEESLVTATPKIFAFGIPSSCKSIKKRTSPPPSKKNKVEHIGDVVGATERANLPGYKVNLQKKKVLDNEVRVSPLVKKFLDLKFNNVSNADIKANNSSFINDMSLDRLVDVLIDSSRSDKNTDIISLNTSMIVNVDNTDLENENDRNETKEDNILNSQQETQLEIVSEASSDSGFKSTNENSHQLDSNFLCKCNNNNLSYLEEDNTMIEVNNTYNERCVDAEYSRKRSSITPEESDDPKRTKLDDTCTLKRQRCIRRRKVEHFRKKLSRINSTTANSETVSPFWSVQKQFPISDEESFSFPSSGFEIENTPLRGCYLENKEILATPLAALNLDSKGCATIETTMAPISLESKSVRTPLLDTTSDPNKTIRKCLKFDSPKVVSDSSSFADSTVRSTVLDVRGSVDLRIFSSGDNIYVNVIRCHDLYRGDEETINAYIKVAISDRLLSSRNKKKNAVLQRTPVQSDSSGPIFNHTFKFAKLPASDGRKRIHVEVWHRDRAMMYEPLFVEFKRLDRV